MTTEKDQIPDPLDQRWFEVDDQQAQALQEHLDREAEFKPRLAALLADEFFPPGDTPSL
jgi:hypothetical protein